MPFPIYLGYDPREVAAFHVAADSIRRTSPDFKTITPLILDDLQLRGLYTRPIQGAPGSRFDPISDHPMATDFAISRFLTLHLARQARGISPGLFSSVAPHWAMFADCDIIVRRDLAQLEAQLDPSKAVMVVKHGHIAGGGTKMDGQVQASYGRKNWSSVILFNLTHPANAALDLGTVNGRPGRDLHAFCWLRDDDIGALDGAWNWLEGISPAIPEDEGGPSIVHLTRGGPWLPGYADVGYADTWLELYAGLLPWQKAAAPLPMPDGMETTDVLAYLGAALAAKGVAQGDQQAYTWTAALDDRVRPKHGGPDPEMLASAVRTTGAYATGGIVNGVPGIGDAPRPAEIPAAYRGPVFGEASTTDSVNIPLRPIPEGMLGMRFFTNAALAKLFTRNLLSGGMEARTVKVETVNPAIVCGVEYRRRADELGAAEAWSNLPTIRVVPEGLRLPTAEELSDALDGNRVLQQQLGLNDAAVEAAEQQQAKADGIVSSVQTAMEPEADDRDSMASPGQKDGRRPFSELVRAQQFFAAMKDEGREAMIWTPTANAQDYSVSYSLPPIQAQG